MYLLDRARAFYLCYTVIQPMGYGWLLSNSCKIQRVETSWGYREAAGRSFISTQFQHILFFSILFTQPAVDITELSLPLPASTLYHLIKSHVDAPVRNLMMLTCKELNTVKNHPTIESLSHHKLSLLHLQSFPKNPPPMPIPISSLGMWNRKQAALLWALKGLSRKLMFWLNSSCFKNSCGDKWWAGQSEGTVPGRARKLCKKDATAGFLQRFTNSTANVSTGNNKSMSYSCIWQISVSCSCALHILGTLALL